jgi:hypothetical protein
MNSVLNGTPTAGRFVSGFVAVDCYCKPPTRYYKQLPPWPAEVAVVQLPAELPARSPTLRTISLPRDEFDKQTGGLWRISIKARAGGAVAGAGAADKAPLSPSSKQRVSPTLPAL